MSNKTHFFASHCFGWATAETREEAIRKAVRHSAGTQQVKQMTASMHKKGEPGFYIWSVEVLAPEDSEYSIEFYAPKGVELNDALHHDVTYITEKKLAYTSRKNNLN